MRSLILLALLLSSPAAAQIAGRHDYGDVDVHNPLAQEDSSLPAPGVERNLRHIDSRIDAARDSGRITRREARALRREARLIGRLASSFASNGVSASEATELEFRARALTGRIALPSQGGSQGGGRGARR
jgi:hypothetical protein